MIQRLIAQGQQKACRLTVARMCLLLGTSRSGYYAARQRPPTGARCAHAQSVRAAFDASDASYGSRRVRMALRSDGVQIGRWLVRRLMREQQLRPVWRRKFVHTTDSRHTLAVAPNVLQRQFEPPARDRAWVCDMTYVRTRRGWLYLAAVMELYSRKIVGWATSREMPATLVCDALAMAIAQRRPAAGLIVHSDRGSQYASREHQELLARHGLRASMSGKGNCWDNAVMERFFLNLKMERVWQRDYANHAEAAADISDYIVGFYNSRRLHSTLGYLPPNVYERQMAERALIEVSEIT